MANKETLDQLTESAEESKLSSKETIDILKEAMDRYKSAITADGDERELALDDVLFAEGKQWPDALRRSREEDDRPCLVINRAPVFIEQINGDQLQNTTGIKIKPYDDKSDPDTADKLEGLIRNIENNSRAQSVYAWAGASAVKCGRGFWRVYTDYTYSDQEATRLLERDYSPDSLNKLWDQEILMRRVGNPFSVVWDESAEDDMLTDAQYMFIQHRIKRTEYERRWPDKAISPLGDAAGDNHDWYSADDLRIAEYWRKVKKGTRTIYQLENNSYTDKLPKGVKPKSKRVIDNIVIEWMLISAADILEGPYDWQGKYFPIIPVWGKTSNVEGQYRHHGIIRHFKDPARMYNYWRSASTEQVALAPRQPYLVTQKMIEKFQAFWDGANKTNMPYLIYTPDPEAPTNHPIRESGAQVPTGLHAEAAFTVEEMKDVTGIPDATLGKPSNEMSGKAIRERRSGSDRANYAYHENLAQSKAHGGRVILDLIPFKYDAARVVRILGVDGQENSLTINHEVDLITGEKIEADKILNMDEIGRYDVVVTTGPSYTTRRQEASEILIDLIRANKEYAPLLMDAAVKLADIPEGEDIVERLRMALPPELKDYIELKDEFGTEAAKEKIKERKQLAQEQIEQPEMSGNGQEPMPEADPTLDIKVLQEQAKLEGIELDNAKKEEELKLKAAQAQKAIWETSAGMQVAPEAQPEVTGAG